MGLARCLAARSMRPSRRSSRAKSARARWSGTTKRRTKHGKGRVVPHRRNCCSRARLDPMVQPRLWCHGTRCVQHARGWWADGGRRIRTVRGALRLREKAARRRPIRAVSTYITEASGTVRVKHRAAHQVCGRAAEVAVPYRLGPRRAAAAVGCPAMRGCRSRRVEGRLPLARVERQSRLLVKIHSAAQHPRAQRLRQHGVGRESGLLKSATGEYLGPPGAYGTAHGTMRCGLKPSSSTLWPQAFVIDAVAASNTYATHPTTPTVVRTFAQNRAEALVGPAGQKTGSHCTTPA